MKRLIACLSGVALVLVLTGGASAHAGRGGTAPDVAADEPVSQPVPDNVWAQGLFVDTDHL